MSVFRLKKPISNEQIAKKLGVKIGSSYLKTGGVFYSNNIRVGSRVDKKTFTLAVFRPDLHQKALKFAKEVEKG